MGELWNPKRWWFFFSIVWRVFDQQETMFGEYGRIVIRVPWYVAWNLAFRSTPWPRTKGLSDVSGHVQEG